MNLLLSLASFVLWTVGVNAQVAGPFGHWEGTITAQFGTLRIALDLDADARGEPVGAFTVPERKLTGLPLVTLKVDGTTVTFEPAAIGARFHGDLTADGTELSGTFESSAGAVPVTLTRNGAAHMPAPIRNTALSPEFAGSWNGTLEVDGGKRVLLTLVNASDGTSAGTLTSVDERGLTLPIALTQRGKTLIVDVPAISSRYTGTLSDDGLQLTGSYATPQGIEVPLSLHRVSPAAK